MESFLTLIDSILNIANVSAPVVASTALNAVVTKKLGDILDSYKERKKSEVSEILIAELRTGRKSFEDIADEDAFISVIYRIDRAATEGAGRENLRYMAQIMNGTVLAGETTPDRALYFINILAEMTKEEVGLAIRMYDLGKIHAGSERAISGFLKDEIVPSYYLNEDTLYAALARLARTGLVLPKSGWGCITYYPSPLMDELAKLIDLQVYNNPL